jgi:chromate transporter
MRDRSALEVLLVFLKLGTTSFGGPIAHIGYFRNDIVVRRRWLDDAAYSDLVALCQFLPGPASSQIGFSLGLIRAGYWGGLAAWTGFTLPSAVLLTAFAYGVGALNGPSGKGALHGLELVAVAVVAQAVWSMARSLCPDRARACIAGASALILLVAGGPAAQLGVMVLGAIAGMALCRSAPPAPTTATTPATPATPATPTALTESIRIPVSRRVGVLALTLYFLLLAVLTAVRTASPGLELFDAFYRSGALVFGGGHVVLPLLSKAFVASGWVGEDAFLSGYGAAQGVPGPLFSFAAYLGAVTTLAPHGIAGAALGIIAIFLPGILLLIGTLPFWDALRRRADAQASMRGINAAVVGLLGAALYSTLWIGSVKSPGDVAAALTGFILLVAWRSPPILVVALGALGGALFPTLHHAALIGWQPM